MNKIFIYLLSIFMIFMASSCDNDGKDINEIDNMTTADSLVYYFGLLRAAQYEQQEIADTILRHKDVKERYLKGVSQGLKLLSGDDEIYNRGVRDGLRMALRMDKFEKDYDTTLNIQYMLDAVRFGILDEDSLDVARTQHTFYKLLSHLNSSREQSDRARAKRVLAESAAMLNMQEISDNLYYKVLKKGNGKKIEAGSTISVEVVYSRPRGESLGIPNPEELVVGRPGMPPVETTMYEHMHEGECCQFITSAEELFGRRSKMINLKPDDVILIRILVTKVVPPDQNSIMETSDYSPEGI